MHKLLIATTLILLLSGCSKPNSKIAGVYETQETKTPIKGTNSWHHSTKWILDLHEGHSFTLRQEKFRIPTRDKMYSPIPERGTTHNGSWTIQDNQVTLNWEGFIPPETSKGSSGSISFILNLQLQKNGNLVSEQATARWRDAKSDNEFDAYLYLITPENLDNQRFTLKN